MAKYKSIHTGPQIDSGVSRALNPDTVPTAGSSNLITSGGTKSALDTFVRPNLLDNWYFVGGGSQQGGEQFPVNQRGQTAYNNQWSYSIDRWLIPGTNVPVTVNSGSVSFNTIDQFTGAILPSGTYTASVLLADGNFFSGTAHYTQGTYGGILEAHFDGKTFFISIMGDAGSSGHPRVRVQIYPSDIALSVVALKLELGSTQTLCHNEGTEANPVWVLNEIPNYQQELAKCQRYYQIVSTPGGIAIGGQNVLYLSIPLVNPMRSQYVNVGALNNGAYREDFNTYDNTAIDSISSTATIRDTTVDLTAVANGVYNGKPYIILNIQVALSADL